MINLPDFNILPRAIALDLDGTLLDSNTRLSDRSHRALEKCILRGIPVIIATSRPARIFHRIFPEDLTELCSLVIMNGAIAMGRPPLSGYLREAFPDELAGEIVEQATVFQADIHITIEIDGYEFGINWAPASNNILWSRNSATPDMVLSVDEALLKQPGKIAIGGIGKNILKLAEKLNEAFGDEISVIPALLGNPLLNITTPQASKPNALRKLLDPAGISLEEVIAFGDDLPDIGMLKECGISVAMANSFPEIKAICAYQTATNDEDGVAMVLEKMLKAIK